MLFDAAEQKDARRLLSSSSIMLPSSKRLTTPLVKEVMDVGKIFHSTLFVFKGTKKSGNSRFSVVVSKKVAKNAVDRNKIRRRLYSAIHSVYTRIQPGFHGIFMVKPVIVKVSMKEIKLSLEEFFVKIGIVK
jgi:ribonuclease P protein component